MAATVGARLEQVERPRSLFGPDYLRLAALAAVALAVHGWLVANTFVTARDSLGFARQALCFENPSAVPVPAGERAKTTIDLVCAAEQPPGYPLAVWAADAALKQVPGRSVAERALLASQLANALAAVLLVVPTYLIGRMLFGRNTGFAAALLFQVLPVPARITSDGLTEGLYLLCAAGAIVFGVRAVRTKRVSVFLLSGLATGASYLVRPEGLMTAAGPGAVVLWLGLTRRWPRDLAFGRAAALGVGVALVAVPYMALIGKISNKPTSGMMNPFDAPPGPVYRGGPEGSRRTTDSLAVFAAWWDHERDAGRSRELWAVGAVFKETNKGANHVIWPLALFALVALRRRFAAEPELWVPVVLMACNFGLLFYLAARVGYVSERHTVLLTLLACQFAAAGLPLLAAALGQALPRLDRLGVRFTAAGFLVALVAGSVPFALKPLHPNREGHKHAGLWLQSHITDDNSLVDPFCWGEWYSGRTLYRTSWNPPNAKTVYVIWENNAATPHSRLPVLPLARELIRKPDARVVYHWPEDVTADMAKVQVWKLGP
ncbi:MAG: glycosyltransferase family 39 protein [Planctomycetes bacterium]|nr:glycosyltransferase family 39 protein [Planctomycetota bacterium]